MRRRKDPATVPPAELTALPATSAGLDGWKQSRKDWADRRGWPGGTSERLAGEVAARLHFAQIGDVDPAMAHEGLHIVGGIDLARGEVAE